MNMPVLSGWIQGSAAPALLVILSGSIGFWLGLRRDAAKIISERRVELLSRFVALAYRGQGYLWESPFDGARAGDHKAELAVLAEELAIYVRPQTARQLTVVVNCYVAAVQARADMENPHMRGLPHSDRVKTFLPALRNTMFAFRRELGTAGRWERTRHWWEVPAAKFKLRIRVVRGSSAKDWELPKP